MQRHMHNKRLQSDRQIAMLFGTLTPFGGT